MNAQWTQFPNLKAYNNLRLVDVPLNSVKQNKFTVVIKFQVVLSTTNKLQAFTLFQEIVILVKLI